jgi:hypothetical protein
MSEIQRERMSAELPGGFVVFLIGMRVNRWWRIDLWLPVALAMRRMLRELAQQPESGFLGAIVGGLSNPSLMVQYWRSPEQLLAYARSQNGSHFPAWLDFQRRIARTEAVGIWHETYVVRGEYETVYHRMPRFGLGRAGELRPARGWRATARGRLRGAAATQPDDALHPNAADASAPPDA